MAEKKKEKKKEKKSKLKKFIGPVTVTPRVSKQTGVDGKIKTDDQGGGLTVDTKFGTFGINKNTNTQSMDGFDDIKTKTVDWYRYLLSNPEASKDYMINNTLL